MHNETRPTDTATYPLFIDTGEPEIGGRRDWAIKPRTAAAKPVQASADSNTGRLVLPRLALGDGNDIVNDARTDFKGVGIAGSGDTTAGSGDVASDVLTAGMNVSC